MAEKSTKTATKRVTSRKPKSRRRKPDHRQIAERAYYIHLDEGGLDEVANWLRADRELAAA